MDKQELLNIIQGEINAGNITASEIKSSIADKEKKVSGGSNIINILYVIGAIIAIVGVATLIFPFWMTVGFVGRLVITFGLAGATLYAGNLIKDPEAFVLRRVLFGITVILSLIGTGVLVAEGIAFLTLSFAIAMFIYAIIFSEKRGNLSQAIFLVSSIVLAYGLYDLLSGTSDVIGIKLFFIGMIMTIVYGFALYQTKKNILFLITIFSLFSGLMALIIEVTSEDETIIKWLFIIFGIAYVLSGYIFNKLCEPKDEEDMLQKRSVSGVCYLVGSVSTYSALMTLGGLFDVLVIIVVLYGMYLSTMLKSRILLLVSALFLIINTIKITGDYFVGSMGWAFSLIFIGFFIIAIGYGTYYLSRNYIKK